MSRIFRETPTIERSVGVNRSSNNTSTAADSSGGTKRLDHPTPKPIFLAEVNYWAEKLGVQPTEVRVREMKNKWGSTTTSGRVSFNSELLWQAPQFRKRVILEQLEHLKTQLSSVDDSPTE